MFFSLLSAHRTAIHQESAYPLMGVSSDLGTDSSPRLASPLSALHEECGKYGKFG